MGDVLDIVGRIVDALFALTCIGAPFLLWNRSKTAALFGAGAGAAYLFAIVVGFILEHAHGSGATPMAVRVAYVLLSGVRNLCFYGALFGVVVVLSRPAPTVPR